MLESFTKSEYLFQYISILNTTGQKQLAEEIISLLEDNQDLQRKILLLNNKINEGIV